MARKTPFEKDSTAWEVDGLPLEVGDTVLWDGNSNGTNQGCSNCDKPHEVEVKDIDRNDPDSAYYISSATRDTCCGGLWVVPKDLKRDGASLPLLALLAKDLNDKVKAGTITLNDLSTKVNEIYTQMARDHYASGKKPFKGTCSACFTDVVLVGGSVEHEDKRICSTPAILLS